MRKPKTEYRISCPNYGTRGHSTHVHKIKTLEKAVTDAEATDRHFEQLSKDDDGTAYSYYRSEIGWTAEKRTVTAWEEVT